MGWLAKYDVPRLLYAVEKNRSSRTLRFWEVAEGRVLRQRYGADHVYVNRKYHQSHPANEFHSYMSDAVKAGFLVDPNPQGFKPLNFCGVPRSRHDSFPIEG